MPQPIKGEKKDTFLKRCIADEESVNSFPDEAQRFAVCLRVWETHSREALSLYRLTFAGRKVSLDYDDTLDTPKGFKLAQELMAKGDLVYIISARQEKNGMLAKAKTLGIPESRIYATGSNKAKVEKIKELGIALHYDNNKDVINELGKNGQLI